MVETLVDGLLFIAPVKDPSWMRYWPAGLTPRSEVGMGILLLCTRHIGQGRTLWHACCKTHVYFSQSTSNWQQVNDSPIPPIVKSGLAVSSVAFPPEANTAKKRSA